MPSCGAMGAVDLTRRTRTPRHRAFDSEVNHTIVSKSPSRGIIRPMVDQVTRMARRRNRNSTLLCESCGRRITWWTAAHAVRHGTGWQWQGNRVPIRYRFVERHEPGFPLVDLECFSCGWRRTYPGLDALPTKVKVR